MDKRFSFTFLFLTVCFCVFLILSNLLEVKVVDFSLLTVTGGLVVFPMSYIINDCVAEVYGFRLANASKIELKGESMRQKLKK